MLREEIEKAIAFLKDIQECTYDRLEEIRNAIKALEQEPCEDAVAKERYGDLMSIHTQGLDEGIRCAMCANSMKSDRGCDGGCVVDDGMYKKVMETIKNNIVPSVTPTQGWIPVSERLPEAGEYVGDVDKYYLVQNEYGDMLVARYTHSEYWEQIFQFKPIGDEIVAWMPLPEPYKAEREDKE